jgi:thiaminase/transcriptional activator TenA
MADNLFERLKAETADDWQAYVDHEFVSRLGDGSLPQAAFRHYLIQDYLFLIQFARAYALAVYKSDTLADMRAAAAAISGILDTEMQLHVEFCADWGLTEQQMEASPEDNANMAYTRYVLEKGHAGDILDLHVALSPCVIGYGEIGAKLAAHGPVPGNPYQAWIDMYAGEDYQSVAAAANETIERLAASRLTEARYRSLVRTFAQATRLEAAFWTMGLEQAT